MKIQRLRITFSRGDETKYISHLDVMRFWERALRRAAIPVAYSEGFSPHAQISLAAPLAVGTTSEAELMDVFLAELMQPKQFITQLSAQIPPGIAIVTAQEVGLSLPSMQADVRFAEYEVDIETKAKRGDTSAVDASVAVERFMAAETIPWEHKRENETRAYDIRAQVAELASAELDNGRGTRLKMRLKNDNTGSGRPEQIVAALGLPAPMRIHRTQIILEKPTTAREAFRKSAQYDE